MPILVQRHTFPPARRCIYCGSAKHPLTDEHIIPAGLNGRLLLPAASCEGCREATSKCETPLINGWFNNLRLRIPLRGRRGKLTKSKVRIQLSEQDGPYRMISAAEYPRTVLLPVFDVPNMIEPGKWDGHYDIVAVASRQDIATFIAKYGNAGSPYFIDVPLFCRMLAKIGHALAVANARDASSYDLLLTDFIRFGRCDRPISSLIGGDPELQPATTYLHEVHLLTGATAEERLLIVKVRLFACYISPSYYVVVGRKLLTDEEQLAKERSLR